MLTRAISGFFFVLILVGAIVYSKWSMFALFFVVTVLGAYEFWRLRKTTYPQLEAWSVIFSAVITFLLLATFRLLHWTEPGLLLVILLVPLVLIIEDLTNKNDTGFSNTTNGLFAVFYIGVPFGLLPMLTSEKLYTDAYQYLPLLSFFILLWTSDTMAYVCGRFLGKHKLWERISPKKTWEGFIGGFLFTLLAAWILSSQSGYLPLREYLLMGAFVSVFGMFGDLSESLLKRQAGVKDSGTIMPGHGGILDRFDGVLLAVPAYFLYHAIIDLIPKIMHHQLL